MKRVTKDLYDHGWFSILGIPWRTKTKFRTSVTWMPRMAREWHPVEEFTTCMILSFRGIDTSMMPGEDQRQRILSTIRLYPAFSEGFQGAGGSRCAGRLNLFASSCQLGLWLDDKGFLHVCSRQTEGFWETANWPRSVPMHGLQCMILLPFKYLHCPCEAACNSSVALRSELSEACTSNISSSSRQRHSKVAEEPGECWHTPNMPKLSAGSCCCPRYITGIWAFRATSRQKRLTDLCWETRTHRPPMWRTTSFHHLWKRIGAKWMKRRMTASSNESCHMAWNFMCPWLRKAERYWVIVKDGLSRVQENVHEKCPWNILKKGLSHFDLACKSHQTDHVWSTGQAACILRIDVMQLEGPLRCT